ncbi:hypothetical protein [Nonomuraea sp. bgisy101]|uniref:hypothetical protein n=1 Tax=Nonomuraea sp. bgisy101 TaxID=3413784 RepID=UPI003D70FED9
MTNLVLGGAGKTGRRVVKKLESLGPPDRVGSPGREPRDSRPYAEESAATGVWGRR